MPRSPRRPARPVLSPAEVAALEVDGWVALPGVLAPDLAADVAARCEVRLADLGRDRRPGDKDVAGTLHLAELRDRVPEALAVAEDQRVQAAVATYLPAGARVDVSYRCPRPGFGEQRFHADAQPLTAIGPWEVVTAIVALCDFTAGNGATAVVPGSHRRPDQQRRSGNLPDHPDAVVMTGPAGTAFVFCGHLLHRGTRNTSTRPRPSLQCLWRVGA